MQPTTGRAHHEIFQSRKSNLEVYRQFGGFFPFVLPVVSLLPAGGNGGCGHNGAVLRYLKDARGQEGQLIPAFFHSFKQNLKQATALWVGYLAVGILLVLDLVICLQTSSVFAGAMFFTSVVLLACWALFITMLFPLVARCDNTIGALFKMGIAMALRNVMPVLAALMVTVAFFAVGVFVFWPVLLVAPGLASYCNAFLFNRIFDKYGMTLE